MAEPKAKIKTEGLRHDIYYFCKLGKKDATIEKIRRYCFPQECPFLGKRKKTKSSRQNCLFLEMVEKTKK
jgi:hypothetical protein